MKSQKGVTLISLTVYIIALLIIITMITIISSFFRENVTNKIGDIDSLVGYTKFNSFFAKEIKKGDIEVVEFAKNYIVFNNDIQYNYIKENRGIYRNKVKIVKDVQDCEFSVITDSSKYVITIKLTMQNDKERINLYTIRK